MLVGLETIAFQPVAERCWPPDPRAHQMRSTARVNRRRLGRSCASAELNHRFSPMPLARAAASGSSVPYRRPPSCGSNGSLARYIFSWRAPA